MDLITSIKTGAAVLLSILLIAAALLVMPSMVNGAGWIGFSGAPVVGLLVLFGLALFWQWLVKKNFKQGGSK